MCFSATITGVEKNTIEVPHRVQHQRRRDREHRERTTDYRQPSLPARHGCSPMPRILPSQNVSSIFGIMLIRRARDFSGLRSIAATVRCRRSRALRQRPADQRTVALQRRWQRPDDPAHSGRHQRQLQLLHPAPLRPASSAAAPPDRKPASPPSPAPITASWSPPPIPFTPAIPSSSGLPVWDAPRPLSIPACPRLPDPLPSAVIQPQYSTRRRCARYSIRRPRARLRRPLSDQCLGAALGTPRLVHTAGHRSRRKFHFARFRVVK